MAVECLSPASHDLFVDDAIILTATPSEYSLHPELVPAFNRLFQYRINH